MIFEQSDSPADTIHDHNVPRFNRSLTLDKLGRV